MQTTEAIEKPQNNVFVEVVKLVKPTADKTPLLKEFMEDPDVTLDIPDVEVDPKAAERVASWQARSSPPPIPASRRLPFSSSLPPSSPLPPLPQDPSLDNFEFNPPSPQQEDNFLDADVSYESNISDDFGFFAAQSRIHAKMDRERNLNADKRGTRRRSADAADTTLEISFSGRPAFATPYVQHRKTSMSSQDLEDITSSKQIQPGAGNDETSSPGPRAHRGRERPRARSRQNRGRRNGKIDVSKRSRVAQDRVKKPLSTKPLGNLGGRAPRKASGSSAGQSRVKKTTRVSVGIEESDIEFADSEEEVRIQLSGHRLISLNECDHLSLGGSPRSQ